MTIDNFFNIETFQRDYFVVLIIIILFYIIFLFIINLWISKAYNGASDEALLVMPKMIYS